MPRAKSEITGGPVIGLRVTEEEYEVYKKLGGGQWLRAYLRDIVERRKEDAKANSATTRGMVAVYQARPEPVPKSTKTNRPFG
jgi:hypothetical protein